MARPLDTLLQTELGKWGLKNLEKSRAGALLDWTPEIAEQYRLEFENHLDKLLYDSYFLGLKAEVGVTGLDRENCLYSAHYEDIMAIYEENKKRPINLVILVEGIGSGKTTIYSIMAWLEWFRLTCKGNPHKYYGIMEDELISIIAMNRSEAQAKRVTLQKVLPRFKTRFNIDYFPPSKRLGREIFIPRNNTLIFAGTSSAASALGYNIYGGVVDEANYLQMTEGSKKVQGANEMYDAAQEMHDAMFGRMTSRFINPRTGLLDGMLFMISSSRYPNDFLEKKAREHFNLGDKSHIYVRRRTTWDSKPKWYFSGVTFQFSLKTKKILDSEIDITVKKEEAKRIQIERHNEAFKVDEVSNAQGI